MKEKINFLINQIKNNELKIEEKISKNCDPQYYNEIKDLLFLNKISDVSDKEKEQSEYLIILIFSNDFINLLDNIKGYITKIEPVISKCLEFKKLEIDYYILLFINLELNHIIQYDFKPEYIDAILEYKESEQNIEQNNDEFSIYKVNEFPESINKNIKPINKYRYIPYIKFEYANNNNYAYYSIEFIKKFNMKICKSETITSLLNYLYPGYTEINLFKSDFMNNLFDDAINNCYYYPYFYDNVAAYTLNRNNQLVFFLNNHSKIKENNLNNPNAFSKYLLSNLGCFIYTEFQELLGHYLRSALSKITKMNYESPRSSISNRNKSEECIEILLFGGRVKFFTIKQLVFILDVKNYELNFGQFRHNFMNLKNYYPSEICRQMLSEININLNNIDLNEKEPNTALFGFKKQISVYDDNDNDNDNENIEFPFMDHCTQNIYRLNDLNNYIDIDTINHIDNLIKKNIKNNYSK